MQTAPKMDYRLTKTAYLKYLTCPQEFWLEVKQPLLFADDEESIQYTHLRQQGYDVESYVKKLARFQTNDNQAVEFQHKFQTETLYVKSDVVVTDKQTGDVDIYEIKGASSVKDEHYDDVAFQKFVAEESGANVRNCYVITMNADYVRRGEIDAEQLFVITDVTPEINALQEVTEIQSSAAIAFLDTEMVPTLIDYANSRHKRKNEFECKVISKYFPEMPDFTVFHIPRIHKPKLIKLLEMGVIDINDIPDDFELSANQREYISTAKINTITIEREKIKAIMDTWEYPLHFLDYETFSYAIPQFDGIRPFQQMCFQYSLHTIDRPGGELRHSAYLARNDEANPPQKLAEHLRNAMSGGIGKVFVWYEAFEKTRNTEMAEMFPDYKDFFDEVNAKTYDLMKIFSERLYVHPEFKGRSSIKKIQPVLVPHLSYNDLDISEGLTATIKWFRAVKWDSLSDEEREKTFDALEQYCHLDTLAMVEIYRVLAAL
jgi:hypothetical protein